MEKAGDVVARHAAVDSRCLPDKIVGVMAVFLYVLWGLDGLIVATRFSRAVGHTGYDAQARGRLVEGAGHVPVGQGPGEGPHGSAHGVSVEAFSRLHYSWQDGALSFLADDVVLHPSCGTPV